jgi:hypothetical protein
MFVEHMLIAFVDLEQLLAFVASEMSFVVRHLDMLLQRNGLAVLRPALLTNNILLRLLDRMSARLVPFEFSSILKRPITYHAIAHDITFVLK